MKKALCCGILASVFFAFTFLLNSSMNLSGGYWMWGACLRYIFMLPMLGIVLAFTPGVKISAVWHEICRQPLPWLIWSTVGFGFFYFPLCLGSVFGESWLVAASWQVTIVCGILLTPLFGKKIPLRNLTFACMILAGIAIMQYPHLASSNVKGNCLALIPIVIAAFCYPLGNRKMMQYCPEEIDTMSRIFGMTLCSYPFWIVIALIAFHNVGLPGTGQIVKSASVALFSGTIATSLFFHGTDLVRDNPKQLALIEAAQCGEVIFTLLGSILFLGEALPTISGVIGLVLIVLGMVLNSILTA